jgi:hypothetical protein
LPGPDLENLEVLDTNTGRFCDPLLGSMNGGERLGHSALRGRE